MSNAAIVEVAMTYPRRAAGSPVLWVMGAFFAILGSMACVQFPHANGAAAAMTAGLAAALAGLTTGILAVHVKSQFTYPLARTIPGYRTPHAAMALAGAIFLSVVIPVSLALAKNVSPIGIVACSVMISGAVWWWIVIQSMTLQLAVLIPWFAITLTDTGRKSLIWVATGNHPQATWTLATAGIVAITLAIWRVATLTEDIPAYHRTPALGRRQRPNNNAGIPSRTKISEWTSGLSEPRERQFLRVERGQDGWLMRLRRWQLGFPRGHAPWFYAMFGAASILFLAGMTWIMTLARVVGWTRPGAITAVSHVIPAFWIVTTPFMVAAIFSGGPGKRFPSFEMLRPVTRRKFFFEMGAALLGNMLKIWSAVLFGMAAAALLTGTWGTSPEWASGALAVSLGGIAFMFGSIVWTMRFRSENARMIGWMLGYNVPVALALLTTGPMSVILPPSTARSLIGAAIITLAGIALSCDAYRKWLTTDLD